MWSLHIVHSFNHSFYNINTKYFPYLEELYISECAFQETFLRNEKTVIKLLQLNPQLRNVSIRSISTKSILNTDLIRSAVDNLQNVEGLSLQLKPITFLDDSDNIFQMKSVKEFRISIESQYNLPDFMPYLPFLFTNLESFRISFPPTPHLNASFTDQFFNFIDKHRSITNLTIPYIVSFGVLDWSKLAKSLPLLLAIEMTECYISADEAFEVMTEFRMLKKFIFRLRGDYDNFRKCLDKKWDGTYERDRKFVTLNSKM